MNALTEGIITIVLAVVGLATLAVILSPKANTAAVTQAGFSGLGNLLGVAESPVSGTALSLNLSYPSSSLSQSFGAGPF
jgi:hypothetical protein